MTKAHKSSSKEGFLLRRHLNVEGLSEEHWGQVLHDLNHNPCVDFAERKSMDRLAVTFDGTHWSTDELISFLAGYGGRIPDGWWQRRKLAWYRFTDDNVRANAKHEPFCCSKIPPMKK